MTSPGKSSLAAAAFAVLCLAGAAVCPSMAQSQSGDTSTDKLSVATPRWHRDSGMVHGTMTFSNRNDYSVYRLLVECDFFDELGNRIGRKVTGIRRVVNPGKSQVGGIYFSLLFDNRLRRDALPGACRVISAKRLPEPPTS